MFSSTSPKNVSLSKKLKKCNPRKKYPLKKFFIHEKGKYRETKCVSSWKSGSPEKSGIPEKSTFPDNSAFPE